MKKISIISAALIAGVIACPAFADPGDSGVIDGTNVKDLFGSGPHIDPDAMEDASVPADRIIRLDPEYPGEKYFDEVQNDKDGALKSTTRTTRTGQGSTQVATTTADNGNHGTTIMMTDSDGTIPRPKHHHSLLKAYCQSWKHFFLSTGNLMGFPVGSDDDGTGNLKPPARYGNE